MLLIDFDSTCSTLGRMLGREPLRPNRLRCLAVSRPGDILFIVSMFMRNVTSSH
jgi:hypothetical protein